MISNDEGARTSLYCATSPEVADHDGRYYDDCREAAPNPIANDPQAAAQYASRLECGTAWVNQHGTLHPMAPFGGVKSSGIGVEFNVDGLKEYTTVQVLNVAL